MLKESARELKDKLAKAATQTEYRLYEREQEVRRVLEAELATWRESSEEARLELLHTRDQLERQRMQHEKAEESLREELRVALDDEKRDFESRLAYEIERTNSAEGSLARAKAKFGKKMWEQEEERAAGAQAAAEQKAMLEAKAANATRQAEAAVVKAREHMEIETRLDLELNDTEIMRVANAASNEVANEREKLEMLLAKHTLQAGMFHKTMSENEQLKQMAEHSTKEAAALKTQVAALREELDSMHVAWADRDVRQREQDLEVKELMQRMQQGQMFTNLATSRIEELNAELEPIREAKTEAQENVAKLEALQVRQAERRLRDMMDHNQMKSAFEVTKRELADLKALHAKREAYFENFSTQLFRTVHGVGVENWPTVFGKLHEDFLAGRDKASWDMYLPKSPGKAQRRGTRGAPPGSPQAQPAPGPAPSSTSAPSPAAANGGPALAPAAGAAAAAAAAAASPSAGPPRLTTTPGGVAAESLGGGDPLAPAKAASSAAAGPLGACSAAAHTPAVAPVSMRDGSSPANSPGVASAAAVAALGQTQFEYEARMAGLQEQVRHLEATLANKQENREKEQMRQKLVIKRMVAENMSVIEEANEYRRELRAARETIDRLTGEVHGLRNNAAAGIVAASAGAALPGGGLGRRSSAAAAVFTGGAHASPSRLARRGSGQAPPAADAAIGDIGDDDGNGRELSAAQMHAAAAANAAAQNAAAAAGTAPAAFPSIPEDRPSAPSGFGGRPRAARDAATSSGQASAASPFAPAAMAWEDGGGDASAARPSPSTVTGDMPSGGWWLGENTMFEVPANLATILKGGDSTMAGAGAGTGAAVRAAGRRPGTSDGPGGGHGAPGRRPATVDSSGAPWRPTMVQQGGLGATSHPGAPLSPSSPAARAGGAALQAALSAAAAAATADAAPRPHTHHAGSRPTLSRPGKLGDGGGRPGSRGLAPTTPAQSGEGVRAASLGNAAAVAAGAEAARAAALSGPGGSPPRRGLVDPAPSADAAMLSTVAAAHADGVQGGGNSPTASAHAAAAAAAAAGPRPGTTPAGGSAAAATLSTGTLRAGSPKAAGAVVGSARAAQIFSAYSKSPSRRPSSVPSSAASLALGLEGTTPGGGDVAVAGDVASPKAKGVPPPPPIAGPHMAVLPAGYLSMLQGSVKPPSPSHGPAKLATMGGGFRSYMNKSKH